MRCARPSRWPIIYSSIISGMMDAFASVISNNLNVIMKVLTSITILLTIPNIIFGFYGMNITQGLPLDQFWWFPLVVASSCDHWHSRRAPEEEGLVLIKRAVQNFVLYGPFARFSGFSGLLCGG